MSDPSAQAFAASWVAAWNAHDIDEILSHYADGIEFSSPVAKALMGEGRVHGLADLRAYWTRGLSLNPELRFHLLEVLNGDSVLTLLYQNERKQQVAETFELDSDGRVVRAWACYGSAPDQSSEA